MMSPQFPSIIFYLLFLFGLIIRISFIPFMGMHDMPLYMAWGDGANKLGLANGYQGIYFPIQYQIFQLNMAVSHVMDIDPVIIFKTVNLMFDFGIFVCIGKLLKLWNLNPRYSYLYWCHPWFMELFALGYIDFHFCLFVLLFIFMAEKSDTISETTAAGIPLGIAFLMKPQAAFLLLGVSLYAFFNIMKNKKWSDLGFIFAPVILFISYSMFFYYKGKPILYLWDSYLKVKNAMPCLVGNMLNIWHPVAYFVKNPDQYIFEVPDNLRILGVQCDIAAMVLVMTLMVIYTILIVKNSSTGKYYGSSMTLLLSFITVVFPMLMTSVHENHLYLGTIFSIVLLPQIEKPVYTYAFHTMFILMFINILGHYGVGEKSISMRYLFMIDMWRYHQNIKLIASFVSIISFLIIVYYFFVEAFSIKTKASV